MASQTKRKHSETFNHKELYNLCDNIRCDNKEEGFDSIREWINNNNNDNNKFKAAITYQNVHNYTPLYLILRSGDAPLDIIRQLIKLAPQAPKMQTKNGWLPIHIACINGASLKVEVLQALVNAHPEGVKDTDNFGWLPIHCACMNKASLTVLNFLVET